MKTLLIAILFSTLVVAQNEYAIEFDRDQNDILYLANADYRGGDSQGFVSMWIYFIQAPNINNLWGSADETAPYSFVGGRYYDGNGTFNAAIIQDGAADAAGVTGLDTTLSLSSYWHIVFGSTGTGYKVWVNGETRPLSVLAGSNDGDWFAETAERDNFVLGAIVTSATVLPTECRIDEVSVHNVAPTQAIVDQIYNGGVPRNVQNVSGGGAVAFWRFEEGSGQFTVDAIGGDTLWFGGDATVETDDPAWVTSDFGWDPGSELRNSYTPFKTELTPYRSY